MSELSRWLWRQNVKNVEAVYGLKPGRQNELLLDKMTHLPISFEKSPGALISRWEPLKALYTKRTIKEI